MPLYEKRGYLNSDFKLFHLTDSIKQDYEYHYHDFDKVVIFIKGDVHYLIEGRTYQLKPYDIVLVHHNDIHKPVINASVPYERIIVYLSPGFVTSYKTDSYDLSTCFKKARLKHSDVLRIQYLKNNVLFHTINSLEYACSHDDYAGELYCQVLFLEFMILLNRAALDCHLDYVHTNPGNEKIVEVIDYINIHLTEDLNINLLSEIFYISKYHLMRTFKKETGYSIGAYITEKRLLMAKGLVQSGIPVTQSCFDCGFHNYSTFSRAYKKRFGKAPQHSKRGSTG